ncbi:MAG: hypothetical protein AAFQ94_28870 [Bacteroidota bacterium]
MKQPTFLLIILIASAIIFACSPDSIEPNKDIQLAESFIGKDYDSVIYYAKNYLAENGNKDYQYYGHIVSGYAYLQKKEFIKATAHYLQANELIPERERY